MPSPAIPISSEPTDESVGSSISLVILSDIKTKTAVAPAIALEIIPEIKAPIATPPTTTLGPALQPDIEYEPSEDLASLDYVPASPDYVLALPDYFLGSDPKESPEVDPSEDDPFGNYVSEIVGLEVQTTPTPPTPLHIIPALLLYPADLLSLFYLDKRFPSVDLNVPTLMGRICCLL
ncbi:hypothetical protein Tco_0481917 [Tanacetum coccineum]